LFGASYAGEIISSYADPNSAFYQWLYEPTASTTCSFTQQNGHRLLLLTSGPAVGFGQGSESVGDFGGGGDVHKIPSGSHYPRQAGTVEAWANWFDSAGPSSALVNVDGECTPMALTRGVVTHGAYKADLSGVGSGCHRYFFVFTDSTDAIVTFPETGSLGIGPAGSCADWSSDRPSTGASCDCEPQCNGRQCGDDSCGGACGNCAEDETCNDGMCQAADGSGGSEPAGVGGSSSASGAGAGAPSGSSGVGGDGNGADSGDGEAEGCACSAPGKSRPEPQWPAALALVACWLTVCRYRQRSSK
jgi:MYXO-CTERM domain-containing protein